MPSNVPTGAAEPGPKADDRVKIVIELLAVAALALLALLGLALCVVVRKCCPEPQNDPREVPMPQQVPLAEQLQPHPTAGLEMVALPKQAYADELHVAVAIMQNDRDNRVSHPGSVPAQASVDEETLDLEAIAIADAHPNSGGVLPLDGSEPRLLPAPAGVNEETLDLEAIAIADAHPN